MLAASCRGDDPDRYYADAKEKDLPGRQTCFTCPVRADCLRYAIALGLRGGIWGGFTERERRRMMKKRGLQYPLFGLPDTPDPAIKEKPQRVFTNKFGNEEYPCPDCGRMCRLVGAAPNLKIGVLKSHGKAYRWGTGETCPGSHTKPIMDSDSGLYEASA